ncbi:unnamed protein product [Leuciscus chuanchicus]
MDVSNHESGNLLSCCVKDSPLRRGLYLIDLHPTIFNGLSRWAASECSDRPRFSHTLQYGMISHATGLETLASAWSGPPPHMSAVCPRASADRQIMQKSCTERTELKEAELGFTAGLLECGAHHSPQRLDILIHKAHSLIPRRSLALSADLISPPLHFLYGRSLILSSTHFPNSRAQRRAAGPVAFPLQRVLALALLLSFYPSISPSTPLNQKPKGLDPLPVKLAPSVCS